MRGPIRYACLMSMALGLAWVVTSMTATPARGQTPNACGCYQDAQGACHCNKKSKCGCPEECEPVGCEQKRVQQANREAEQELKRIAVRDKKKAAEAQKELREKRAREQKEARAAKAKARRDEKQAKDEVDKLLK